MATAVQGKIRHAPAWLAACLILPMFLVRPASAGPAALPRFEDFPVRLASTGRNRLVLKGDDVHWRTRLREAAAGKPDFAGHYVLATWGCGAECVTGAAIDVRTGVVSWLPGTLCCWFSDEANTPDTVEPLRYRLHSRLLVLTGRRDERNGDAGTHYYAIEGGRFMHLRDVPPGPARP